MTISAIIADDEAALREVLADVLGSDGRVTWAGSAGTADEAIALARATRPDVALVDVKMPGGGAYLTRSLVESSPRTRVIALTAYGDDSTVLDLLRAGARGYLLKGTVGDDIVEAVVRCADGQLVVSPEVMSAAGAELRDYIQAIGGAEVISAPRDIEVAGVARPARAAARAPSADAPISVVLADDHPVVRSGLRSLVERADDLQVVAEVADAESALRSVVGHRPRVLVLDLNMPGQLNPLEAIAKVGEASPGTRVVVLTMEAAPEFARRALDAGASGFVLKDHAGAELVEAIRDAARGES